MWFLPHLFCHHDLFTFQKFCACVDETFLVPNKYTWQSLERQQEIMAWNYSLQEDRFICKLRSRLIFLIFCQLQLGWTYWVFTSYFMILKILCMSLFGCFRFWAPTRFPEVICPRYNPAFRGWSRVLIWVLVELCQVEGQLEVPPWLARMEKFFKTWWELRTTCPTFLSKYWQKHKRIRVLW